MTARKKSVAEMARDKGIKPSLVYNRINRGWTLSKALNTPVNIKNRPYKAKAQFVEEYASKPAANDEVYDTEPNSDSGLWIVFWGLLTIAGMLALHSFFGQ